MLLLDALATLRRVACPATAQLSFGIASRMQDSEDDHRLVVNEVKQSVRKRS
jgi:hypothetical protein